MKIEEWIQVSVVACWTFGGLMIAGTYVDAIGDLAPTAETYGAWTGLVGLLFVLMFVIAPTVAIGYVVANVVKNLDMRP